MILPRMVEGGAIKWYVLCQTDQTARVVRDELRAFVGRSYSSFDGRLAELRENDEIERELDAVFQGRVYLLETPDPSLEDGLREKLQLLLRLWQDRPVRLATMPRATGRVLRDFEFAIASGDGDAASACILELRTTGRLGAFNALFLEVRRLGSLGLWKDILAMPAVGALLANQRPRRVTETLIRAVYETHLRQCESDGKPSEAIEVCAAEVLPRYGDLYKSQVGFSGYEIDASFLIAAVASKPPIVERVRAIVASYGRGVEHSAYITAIGDCLDSFGAPRSGGPQNDARNALAGADFDRAFALASDLPDTFDKVAILLQCAKEMGSLEAAKVALTATDGLRQVERDRFLKHAGLVRIYDGLFALIPPTESVPLREDQESKAIPSSGGEWIGRLVHPTPWPAAVTVAEVGSREWSLQELVSAPESIASFELGLLATRPPWGEEALQDALPYMIGFFLSMGADVRLRPIYENLFLIAASETQTSLPQLAALCSLAEARITIGIKASDYRDIVHAIGEVLEHASSPQATNSALEVLDTLATLPCADEAARQGVVVRVQSLFARWYRRIGAEQWLLFQELAREIGVSVAGPTLQQESTSANTRSKWSALAEVRIALYSLREPALRRARATLKQLCPSVDVQLFSDHVGGSPSLRAAASTADVFVIATGAAKHAATGFIEACRPTASVTLRARGQGSAGLLGALAEFVDPMRAIGGKQA
jgi:hypothetical protein